VTVQATRFTDQVTAELVLTGHVELIDPDRPRPPRTPPPATHRRGHTHTRVIHHAHAIRWTSA
jgi:hypothetical protein